MDPVTLCARVTSVPPLLPAELKLCARRSQGREAGACLTGVQEDQMRCPMGCLAGQGWKQRATMTAGFGVRRTGREGPKPRTIEFPGWRPVVKRAVAL